MNDKTEGTKICAWDKCDNPVSMTAHNKIYCSKKCRWSHRENKKEERLKSGLAKDEEIQRKLIKRAKCQSAKRGIYFSLRPEDIPLPKKCPILGVDLGYCCGDNSYSIDRIDSSGDYVPGNVAVISWRANNIKGNAKLEELENLVKWLKSLNKANE